MLALYLACALAQPPAVPPAPPAPPATIDQLVARIAALRAQQADLAKQEATASAELRARVKELTDQLDRLGLSEPRPTPSKPAPPADPLKAKLAAAYAAAAGTDAQKRDWAKDLAALYRSAAKVALDPKVTTTGALRAKLGTAAEVLVGADALVEVRKAVAGELAAVLPTDADLTADQRTAVGALFARLAAVLDALAN
jgi:hypothetical protein